MIDPIRGSIWMSNINTALGSLLLGSCALWAFVVIVQTAWNINPISQAFAQVIAAETTLPH